MNKTYKKRAGLGVCILCGGKLDRCSAQYCTKCAEERKKTRNMYISHGVCPICKKNSIFGDEKSCPECRVKNLMYTRKANVNRKHKSDMAKKIYNERKAEGICVKCGKNRSENGRVKCKKCLEKDIEIKKMCY